MLTKNPFFRLKQKTEESKKVETKTSASTSASTSSSSSSSASTSSSSTSSTTVSTASSTSSSTTTSMGSVQLRLQNEFTDLEIPKNCKLIMGDKKDMTKFNLFVYPDEGYWKGGQYEFTFHVSSEYPFKAPKVMLVDKIYHPNIDLEGNICLNILRPNWKPTHTLQLVIFGLMFLFTHPNPNDPLNHDAAEVFRTNPTQFERNVRASMRGTRVGSVDFPRNKGTGVR
eukprot:TRINITY_DN8831_c0_g1_i1.p1 TRINITY_DN8831_c0_g1~~TRINITY_DN8831_c0_g1_i1.p1  ORF type:complete len:227 (-),score=69.14 TRINITY_DN8831_c0_g1_i1:160-840(-)